ncbi:Lrp/AsnC family transcriptional regulator [Arthrobacter glacialis]|uniref:AsnC family transcriptional regulator n=1 Tax=Arthrobacter glacialis TaxID=1664 RepID=A0A2S3ZWR0_ARTGL|nr:Lrp/AsnC family transcriptional regulator [Arthrobacter glacialis]POH73327.1 AsnC family transcriptional regulator [Arthrobacter glacialis]
MDSTDETILSIFRQEARISFSELGARIGLSTNAASARVRRLETRGVIVGYQAVLAGDVTQNGPHLEAFIDVRLKPDGDSTAFLAWTSAEPAIRDAVHVTGPYDYILHVVVPSTKALDQLLRKLKADGGAAQTQTRLALR